MTTVTSEQNTLPTADHLRDRVRAALQAIGADARLGETGDVGVPASTPITGDVLFTVSENTAEAASYSASGTVVSATRVTVSAQASAARSRGSKRPPASRQAWTRTSFSMARPPLIRSRECMSMQ